MSEEASALESIRQGLKEGEYRLTNSSVPLRLSWFPDYLKPDFVEEIYGVKTGEGAAEHSDGKAEVESEFWEELNAFKEMLRKGSPEGGELADWQDVDIPAARRMYRSLNRKAEALSLWDQYAVPLRYKNGRIYRIWSPKDVMNPPIIRSLPIHAFLSMLCVRTASDSLEIANLKKRVEFWQQILAFAVIVILCCLAILLAR